LGAEGLVLALLLAAAVTVESTAACPTAAAVEAHLPPLATPADGAPDRARVSGAPGGLTLTLSRADGSAVVERQLEAQGTCDELAGALALMIAVWHAKQHTELPRPGTLQAPAPAPPSTVSVEAGTQLYASLIGGEVSPGALLSAVLWRRAWGLGLAVSGTTLREQALGRGVASWTRAALGLGPAHRLLAQPVGVDVWVGALAGLTMARGSGFSSNDTATAWTPGAGAGLTFSRAFGPWLLSLGAGGALWRAQQLAVSGTDVRLALPQAEARAGAGLGLKFDL
jgi:hypothetical protein